MWGSEQQKGTSTCLIRAAAFLHNILRPTNSGLQSELELRMSPWIVDFKVGTVIQTPNESALPQLECGVLALAVKAPLGTKQLERLNEFVLPERSLGTGGASLATDFEFPNLLDDVINWS